MDIVILAFMSGVLLTAAGYAHYRIPACTRDIGKRALLHIVLVIVGLGCGYVSAANIAPGGGPSAVFLLLIGFGLVHVPAAIILFIKQQRGENRS
jgi:hypothetical protein